MKHARREEFAAVALGFLSALYNAAHRLAGSEHDAEDLVQETYLEAFRRADQLRDLARCKTWLFRILRNRFLSVERGRRARPELVVVEGGFESAEAAIAHERLPQLERALIGRLARPAILQALGRLPEEFRTAVLLCDLDGFNYDEIAEIMQCPVGTVRSRIARARSLLARRLAAHAAGLGIGKGPRS
jgi:RNA polymerase sigma-70 factor (ECF subfamily)